MPADANVFANRAFLWLVVAVTAAFAWIVWPFFGALLWATILAILFFASGVFHGYAYGESIVGAETAQLAAYVLGFGAIQYCIAVGSGAALRTIAGRDHLSEAMAMRIAGGGIALVAAFAFVNIALAG